MSRMVVINMIRLGGDTKKKEKLPTDDQIKTILFAAQR